GERPGHHTTPVGIGRSAKHQANALYSHRRQSKGPVDSVVYSEVGRIEGRIWHECDVNAIEPEPRFIHRACSKGVCFTECENLALSATSVTEAWDTLQPSRGRLDAAISLKGVVPMQRVTLGKPVIQVERELVVPDRRNCRPAKRAGSAVRFWYQWKQLLHYGSGHGSPLRIRQHAAAERYSLTVRQTFVAEKKERPVLHDGTAQRASVLIAPESRLRNIEKVSRIKNVVAQIVKDLPVKLVGTGLGCNVEDRAGVTAVFGTERRICELDFVDCVYGRLKRDLIV